MAEQESKTKTPINRREFLESSARNAAQAAAGVVAISQVSPLRAQTVSSSIDSVRLGFIGLRNQGTALLKSFQQAQGCEIVALCDIDESVSHGAMKLVEAAGHQPFLCDDFRTVLDSPQVDAVVIATPDHHHAWMAAMACDAGKDIYLEVPTTHTLQQGDQLQEMISKTGAIVQVGLQQRSGQHFCSAMEFLHCGQLGAVYQARAWSSLKRKPLRRYQQTELQATQNYGEQFLSEAAQQAWLGEEKTCKLHPLDWHYHWRWMWNYGSGELGNWGVHLLDVARWGLNVSLPLRVSATGSCSHFDDGRETPDTMNVFYDFGGQSITWEHRQWSARGIEGRSHGVAFYGERGVLILDRSGWKVYDQVPSVSVPASELRISHAQAFIDSVKNRSEPTANFELGCLSTQLCHLGNLAYQTNRELLLNPETGKVIS